MIDPVAHPHLKEKNASRINHLRTVESESIFNAFGAHIQLFEAGPRILSTEDEDVSAAMVEAFRRAGIVVHEKFGTIESFEKTSNGVRMFFTRDGRLESADAAVVILAVGWVADAAGLALGNAGVETDPRGYV